MEFFGIAQLSQLDLDPQESSCQCRHCHKPKATCWSRLWNCEILGTSKRGATLSDRHGCPKESTFDVISHCLVLDEDRTHWER